MLLGCAGGRGLAAFGSRCYVSMSWLQFPVEFSSVISLLSLLAVIISISLYDRSLKILYLLLAK